MTTAALSATDREAVVPSMPRPLVALFAVAMVAMLLSQDVGVSSAVVRAIVLAWGEVLTVAAIAIFFSSFSTPFLSGIFALAMWVIGRVTPDIEAAMRDGSGWIKVTARVALEIVPDIHLFSPSGRVIEDAAQAIGALAEDKWLERAAHGACGFAQRRHAASAKAAGASPPAIPRSRPPSPMVPPIP